MADLKPIDVLAVVREGYHLNQARNKWVLTLQYGSKTLDVAVATKAAPAKAKKNKTLGEHRYAAAVVNHNNNHAYWIGTGYGWAPNNYSDLNTAAAPLPAGNNTENNAASIDPALEEAPVVTMEASTQHYLEEPLNSNAEGFVQYFASTPVADVREAAPATIDPAITNGSTFVANNSVPPVTEATSANLGPVPDEASAGLTEAFDIFDPEFAFEEAPQQEHSQLQFQTEGFNFDFADHTEAAPASFAPAFNSESYFDTNPVPPVTEAAPANVVPDMDGLAWINSFPLDPVAAAPALTHEGFGVITDEDMAAVNEYVDGFNRPWY
ncbi:uncharacterized protein AB675_3203 [Cyphellophora attinorum]|uniref:Uncharacterized protein n=1 Tax=Cyphellophora attinorum TaxID=1664694 RepID=A0A0N1HQT3_9EURO|nr:uncharacterized protein AB675_3203 [Phialophora attinorum]KPI37960.1 hypothetical protein AB675_3203 [Phialophora attinorum]